MVILADISADIGEIYDAMDGGSTAVTSIIGRATDFIQLQSSPAPEAILRPLSDAMCVAQVMGSIDPVNKTIGTLSVGDKDLRTMHRIFMQEANKAAVLSGISLDGLTLILVDSETA